ncbi:hypothetical protein E2C01_027315 [Portunus trituberculatus]|uniref:Uncharacterized protein n=1 Tax=Portunus trituberculatus TaxID=210409 RepID=A0A5B7EL07_PORTR|nr:hypothetical protein [Portunus trituberculatus]
MSRLADYFAIVGYDHKNDRKLSRAGQRGVLWAAGVCLLGWAAAEGSGTEGGMVGEEEGLSCHLVSLGHPSPTPTTGQGQCGRGKDRSGCGRRWTELDRLAPTPGDVMEHGKEGWTVYFTSPVLP